MSQRSITDLNINSLTISNSNYSNVTGYTLKENILTTNDTGELLVNGSSISSGGGNTYSSYKLTTDTLKTGDGSLLTLFGGQIKPLAGVYLITTDITFEGYQANGEPENIVSARVSVIYNNGTHGNHSVINNLALQPVEPTSTFGIQTCGVFTSNGTGEIVVDVSVNMDSGDDQYNIITSDYSLPQVQLIKLT